MPNINLLTYILVFITAFIIGIVYSIRTYPKREVAQLFETFLKEGYKISEWKHFRELVDHHVKYIVKPNCETLYSSTFIRLENDNYKLTIPQVSEYFSVSFLNIDTDVIAYITNLQLNKSLPTSFVLSNKPNNKGDNEIILNTNLCWIIVRYGIPSADRIHEIHELQNNIDLIRA